jgi:hypothetical protein
MKIKRVSLHAVIFLSIFATLGLLSLFRNVEILLRCRISNFGLRQHVTCGTTTLPEKDNTVASPQHHPNSCILWQDPPVPMQGLVVS